MDPRTDTRLLRDFVEEGDRSAYTALVDRHWDVAYRLAHRCLNAPSAAEDVAQDVFVNLARRPERLEVPKRFDPWFRTLVLNSVRNRVKGQRRREHHERGAGGTRPDRVEADPDRGLTAEEVRSHVAMLPLDVRSAVVLRYFEDHAHKEVAEILGCPPGTASSRIRRGLEQLREALAASSLAVTTPGLEKALRETPPPNVPASPSPAELLAQAVSAGRSVGNAVKLAVTAAILGFVAGLGLLLGADSSDTTGRAEGPAAMPTPIEAPVDPDSEGEADRGALVGEVGDASRAEPSGEDDTASSGDLPQEPPPGEPVEDDDPPEAIELDPDQQALLPPFLKGRALDAWTGQPIEGVELFAVRRFGGEPWRATARTDPQGSYDLKLNLYRSRREGKLEEWEERTPVSEMVLVARHEGYASFVRYVGSAIFPVGVDLLLEPHGGYSVRGRVVSPQGTPLAGLRLEVRVHQPERPSGRFAKEDAVPEEELSKPWAIAIDVTSDADGRFRVGGLPEADCELSLDPGAGYTSAPLRVRSAREPAEVVLRASHSPRLTVRVLRADGSPARFARVSAEPLLEEIPGVIPEIVDPDSILTSSSGVRVDAQGYVTLSDLGPGKHRVTASFPESNGAPGPRAVAETASETVELVEGQTRQLTIRAPGADELGDLICLVRDADGGPAKAARVWITDEADEHWERAREAPTDADGKVTFAARARGLYKVTVAASEPFLDEPRRVRSVALREAELTVELTYSTRPVRGSVRGIDGKPISGITVRRHGGGSATTDSSGRFELQSVETGETVFVFEPERYLRQQEEIPARGDVELVLTPARVLTVRVSLRSPIRSGTQVAIGFLPSSGGKGGLPRSGCELLDPRTFEVELIEVPQAAGDLAIQIGDTVPVRRAIGAEDREVAIQDLVIEPGRTVRGQLTDPTGFVRAGGMVFYSLDPPGIPLHQQAFRFLEVGPKGRFELRGVPAGPLELLVGVGERTSERWAAARLSISDQEEIALSLSVQQVELEFGGFLQLNPLESSMRLNMDLEGVDLGSVIKQIARQVGAKIEVDGKAAKIRVTAIYRDTPWKVAVDDLAKGAGCRVVEAGDGGLKIVPKR